ncbi:pyrroline-5-carboxylate reductase [Vagococcus sp. JNUCC 83]
MKIGIFGAGHMGGAMIKGWVHSQKIQPTDLLVKGGRGNTATDLQKDIPFHLTTELSDFNQVDIIFLAVKTPIILPVINDLKSVLTSGIPIISVSAGVPVKEMQKALGENYPVAQAIPNTPVQINQGITGIVYADSITEKQKELVHDTLNILGSVEEITADKIDIFGTLAGCGPAFVDVFMEALGDSAVMYGMDRELAYNVAAKMVSGSANLLLESQKHPGELKDQVTSPGGTTIKGVVALEKNGFRYATISGIDTIMESYK